jgi:hypothetical protein
MWNGQGILGNGIIPSDRTTNEDERESEVSASETSDINNIVHSVLDIPASYQPLAQLFTENTQLKADVNASDKYVSYIPDHMSKQVSMQVRPQQCSSVSNPTQSTHYS